MKLNQSDTYYCRYKCTIKAEILIEDLPGNFIYSIVYTNLSNKIPHKKLCDYRFELVFYIKKEIKSPMKQVEIANKWNFIL